MSDAFEKFSVYKFSVHYPAVCRVEFNPKSRREAGDVVFHFPDQEKFFVSWNALESAQKKFQTVEQQAEHSLNVVKKSRNIKDFERVAQDTLDVNSHKASFNHISLKETATGFFTGRKAVHRETYSVHIHCEKTSRYFVLYALLSSKAPEDFGELFTTIVDSFKCH